MADDFLESLESEIDEEGLFDEDTKEELEEEFKSTSTSESQARSGKEIYEAYKEDYEKGRKVVNVFNKLYNSKQALEFRGEKRACLPSRKALEILIKSGWKPKVLEGDLEDVDDVEDIDDDTMEELYGKFKEAWDEEDEGEGENKVKKAMNLKFKDMLSKGLLEGGRGLTGVYSPKGFGDHLYCVNFDYGIDLKEETDIDPVILSKAKSRRDNNNMTSKNDVKNFMSTVKRIAEDEDELGIDVDLDKIEETANTLVSRHGGRLKYDIPEYYEGVDKTQDNYKAQVGLNKLDLGQKPTKTEKQAILESNEMTEKELEEALDELEEE